MSEGEWPLEEWVGLGTFLFWGAAGRSADPGGSGTGGGKTDQVIARWLVFFSALNVTQASKDLKKQVL